jgi:hypothetical protein
MAINIHIETLNVTPDVFTSVIGEQLRSGADPEVLRDMGYSVPEGASAKTSAPAEPRTAQEEEERLQALAETVVAEDHIKPHTRKAHLYKAIDTAAKLRRIRAGVTTSQETGLRDMDLAENAHEGYTERFSESLAKACGACAFQGKCRLEGRSEAWLRSHPHQKPTNKRQEGIQKFRDRLDADPMAHCVPPGVPRQQRVTSK